MFKPLSALTSPFQRGMIAKIKGRKTPSQTPSRQKKEEELWKQFEARAALTRIPSSFITDLKYDVFTQTLSVFIQGRPYLYPNITASTYLAFEQGRAACRTKDKRGRWWPGKFPSLGAYYNQYIKIS